MNRLASAAASVWVNQLDLTAASCRLDARLCTASGGGRSPQPRQGPGGDRGRKSFSPALSGARVSVSGCSDSRTPTDPRHLGTGPLCACTRSPALSLFPAAPWRGSRPGPAPGRRPHALPDMPTAAEARGSCANPDWKSIGHEQDFLTGQQGSLGRDAQGAAALTTRCR